MSRRFSTAIILIGAVAMGKGQMTSLAVPDGTRHFIVLFDTSASMWATGTKRRALDTASQDLASALYDGSGDLKAIPTFRTRKDLLTVVHFGFDRSRDHARAYERLRYANLRDDFVRVQTPTTSKLDKEGFLRSFEVTQANKTNINALGWAFPLGIGAARVRPETNVQNTYVILVNDSQINDGSIALERLTLGHWLGNAGRQNLAHAEEEQSANVQLVNNLGNALPLVSKQFGRDQNMVTVAAFQARPLTSINKAALVSHLKPLEGLSVRWTKQGDRNRLSISFEVPNELRGKRADLSASVGNKGAATEVVLERTTTAEVPLSPDFADETARIVLRPELSAENPLLGTQVFSVPYEELVRLPSSPESSAAKRNRAFFWFLLAAGAAWGGITFYRHGWLLSHLRIRLPGYAPPFDLPPLSQNRAARFAVRVPAGNGEAALVLLPPSGLVHKLFYKESAVSWDSQLRAVGLNEDVTQIDLAGLGGPLHLEWRDRPQESTTARVIVERKLLFFPTHRLEILVRFAALPRLSGNRRILGGHSTS